MDRDRVRCGRPAVALGLLLIGLAGCVERRYTIRTEPPGALVIVNGQELGTSPVSAPFTYYGKRDITLIAPGFQTKRLVQPIDAPWWDNIITEFFTENLVPVSLRDEREFDFHMEPLTLPVTNTLIERGGVLKAQAQTEPPPRRTGLLGALGF